MNDEKRKAVAEVREAVLKLNEKLVYVYKLNLPINVQMHIEYEPEMDLIPQVIIDTISETIEL